MLLVRGQELHKDMLPKRLGLRELLPKRLGLRELLCFLRDFGAEAVAATAAGATSRER